MPQFPLSMQQIVNADFVHQIEGIRDVDLHIIELFLFFLVYFLGFGHVLHGFLLESFFSCIILKRNIFERVLNVEHCGVIHVQKRVKYFLLLFQIGIQN